MSRGQPRSSASTFISRALAALAAGLGMVVASPAPALAAGPVVSSFSPTSRTIGASVTLATAVKFGGVVYAGSYDGNLYAFDLSGGLGAPARPAPGSLHPDYRLTPAAA